MPYVNAVIHETLRFSDIVSLGLFHGTQEDVEFEGLTIPKVFIHLFCNLFLNNVFFIFFFSLKKMEEFFNDF